jgi:hypothetical protein
MCRLKTSFSRHIINFIIAFIVFDPSLSLAQGQVSVQVEGEIKPYCGFQDGSSIGALTADDLVFDVNPQDESWSKQSRKVALALSCNAPFRLAVRSSQGGLKNLDTEARSISGSFSNEIAYQLALSMTTDNAAEPLVLTCQSADLAGTDSLCGASSGSNAAIGRGAGVGDVAITLFGSSGSPIRGRYQDTIVLALAFQ